MGITITEALAEIKTIQKRIEKKREFVKGFLARMETRKDPFEKEGGSFQAIAKERQAIADLSDRIVELRRGIQSANDDTELTINGQRRTISEWLIWRREVAPSHRDFLGQLRANLNAARQNVTRSGGKLVAVGEQADEQDLVVNVNERELADEIEQLEDTLGQLDGQLSLKNATVQIAA